MSVKDSESKFHDAYRSVFRFGLNGGETVASVADAFVRDWLATRKKGVARNALDRWDGRAPTSLPGGTKINFFSFEDERSGDCAVRYRITDPADEGEYRVTVSALSDRSVRGEHGVSFVIEMARNVGEASTHRINPPRIVGQILDDRRVFDGRTRLQGRPRTIRNQDVEELVEAIADPDRQVAVVLATSLAPEVDEKWRVIVGELTKDTVGTAAVFVVAANAVEELNEALPEGLRTKLGNIRTIAPRVNFENPDVRRHPVLDAAEVAEALNDRGLPTDLASARFAVLPRQLLLDAPIPPTVRRGMSLLGKEERRSLVSLQVEESVEGLVQQASQGAASSGGSTAMTATLLPTPIHKFPRRSEHHARDKEVGGFWRNFYNLVSRWLGRDEGSVTEGSIEEDLKALDLRIVHDRQEIAVHEKFLSQAEADRDALEVRIAELGEEVESLHAQLEAAHEERHEALTELASLRQASVAGQVPATAPSAVETSGSNGYNLSSLEAKVSQVTPTPSPAEEEQPSLRQPRQRNVDAIAEVRRGLDLLAVRLDPIIQRTMTPLVGQIEWTDVLVALDDKAGRSFKTYNRKDPAAQLAMLTQRLGAHGFPFEVDRSRSVSSIAQQLRILRNDSAHYRELEDEDGFRVHDLIVQLLKLLNDSDGSLQALAMREQVAEKLWAFQPMDILTEVNVPPVEEVAPALVATRPAAAEGQQALPVATHDMLAIDLPQSTLFDTSEIDAPILGQTHLEYEPWQTLGLHDPVLLDSLWRTTIKEKVRGVAEQIAEVEGPVSLNRLLTLTGKEFGFQRLHSDRKKRLEKEIKAANLLLDADDFVWPEGIDPENWEQFRPSPPEAQRDFVSISPVEIRNAARFVLDSNEDMDEDGFELAVLEVFGCKRRTEGVRAHLRKGLDLLEEHTPSD
ncbi:Swt1 family HEPN domain-containing protein [Actinomyces minihominis]|uniref:Swt1 family HEPN domain-containing protein n=1 Tax=Actinomyces minihominis TaxID=2002838 RepID=UPI000C087C16|nr:Swt1 family HEPN domain-containing protein [Actinomyces minihominis]